MNPFNRKAILLPLMLATMALRAIVPAGYMPASPGDGLLFVLCHEMAPIEWSSGSTDDAHSSQHSGEHSHHGGDETVADACSLGHMLSMAFVDGIAGFDIALVRFDAIHVPQPVTLPRRALRSAHGPRGPPTV